MKDKIGVYYLTGSGTWIAFRTSFNSRFPVTTEYEAKTRQRVIDLVLAESDR